jgi:hypothetical protein
MIPRRVADPGPRTVALARPRRTIPGRRSALVVAPTLLVLVSLLLAACGATTLPSHTPFTLDSPSPSGAAAGGSAAPGGSQAPWPGTTVLATIAMGAADGEIQKAGADLQAAADKQDLRAMWGAADGLATMIDGLIPNIDRLEVYEGTRPAAAIYRKAFPEISAGAKQLRDAITSGDTAGVVAGSQTIARGLADYAPVRQLIGGLVEQAIVQQRLLTQ